MTNSTGAYIRLAIAACSLLVAYGCGGDDDSSETAVKPSTKEENGPASSNRGSDADKQPSGGIKTAVPDKLTVSGPIEGAPYSSSAAAVNFDEVGYQEKEYFFDGGASSYSVDGMTTADGKWNLKERDRAYFKTRTLVRRPMDAARFNGTVLVEWFNVSGGVDADPWYMYNLQEILREGYAYVAVSAQSVGVDGGALGALLGEGQPGDVGPLKTYNPDRYGSLVHPGDDYSYDIFTQAAAVIRGKGGMDVLGGLKPQYLIAAGESQSAGRMVSYVNGVHPLKKAYDAYFIHSRGAAGSGFDSTDLLGALGSFGSAQQIRDDIDVPVFQFQTETDVAGFLAARQPDSAKTHTWEVAGTAHADKYLLELNATNPLAQQAGFGDCPGANDGPQQFVIKAGLHHLQIWVRDGIEPPTGDQLQFNASGTLMTDEHGNALGGIRTPDVDVPIATYTGAPPTGEAGANLLSGGNAFCFIFGSTTRFPDEKLMQLYPAHQDYVNKVKASAADAVQKGFLMQPEADAMIAEADAADVPAGG